MRDISKECYDCGCVCIKDGNDLRCLGCNSVFVCLTASAGVRE